LSGSQKLRLVRCVESCRKAAVFAVGNSSETKEKTMSDNTKTNETTGSKLPSHNVYQVRDREGRKPIWTRIGSAWAHKDANGFNVQLDCIPLDGRIVLRIASEKKE
jgi:hypothetical protein